MPTITRFDIQPSCPGEDDGSDTTVLESVTTQTVVRELSDPSGTGILT